MDLRKLEYIEWISKTAEEKKNVSGWYITKQFTNAQY